MERRLGLSSRIVVSCNHYDGFFYDFDDLLQFTDKFIDMRYVMREWVIVCNRLILWRE